MIWHGRLSVSRGRVLVLALLVVATARPLTAQVPLAGGARLALEPQSRLWLEGTSNLHDWRCDASEISAEILVAPGDTMPGALPHEISGVVVRVPVKAIRCQNDRMNGNLWKALRAGEFPTVEFRMTAAEPVSDSAGAERVAFAVDGELALAGTTKPIGFLALGTDAGAAIRITGTVELLMTDFGVKPPTAMLGVLKTGNRVLVQFDLMTSYEELAALLGAGDRRLAAGAGWWR